MDFHAMEEADGVRFSFTIWPTSRLEATRCVVPLGCHYSPLKKIADSPPPLPYEPIFCKGPCRAVLNPACQVDYRNRIWICPFCATRNHFPHHYADINETNLPAELIPQFTTIEYQLQRPFAPPPVFLLVVDTSVKEKELMALKDSLLMALNLIPENARIGLITFGATVQVHEIASQEMPKCYVFRGTKDVNTQIVQDFLGLGPRGMKGANPDMITRFIQPYSECEFSFTGILEGLEHDPWPVKIEHRPLRCTGAALAVAAGLLECSNPNNPSRIMMFLGGPCTEGPGQVVGVEKEEPMRGHSDIDNDSVKWAKKATQFYNSIAQRCVQNGHVIDIFACALDQCGVHEMKACVEKTGGSIVQTDTFSNVIFKESFKRIFARDEENNLKMAFNAELDVITSREFKVAGAIGCCASLNKKTPFVAETEIGQGGTSAWKICGLHPGTSVSIFFEVTTQHTQPIPPGQLRYTQFQTHYIHSTGQHRLRVTTLAQSWATAESTTENKLGPHGWMEVASSFDQEATAALMARWAVHKAETEESFDILRWLDRKLIQLCQKFAEYRKDDASSFRLAPNFSIYPQFMFNLRRSQFLHVFGSSPDETAFFRIYLLKEGTTNMTLMIQPSLLAFSFNHPPGPVLLDVSSIAPDRILLLDTYFNVVLFHGETIAEWKRQKFQENPEYVSFKQLLEAPQEEAKELMRDRFPYPRFVDCDQHGSQARFLLSKVNPSSTHNQQVGGVGEIVQTDDVSFQTFMEYLQRLTVQS
ncbi:secretory protein 23A [Guillardia theta CCMP2712]|uniref:Protein transport protein SEC23 n=1 Tax=Guillardia theta (strain CCMP2712) TaxID=905079 RepID=L1JEV3_GUITC|nr:secretory protein 23A [Guillardia theta CCMP2712]EKX47073.1 secretory protein 23A [Guillardia theta CCMP2712]|mmetsp:Transcript_11657/g.40244  ORF Transcript_11657/g.40244 Transcript_11657/m.40244 type:complete len:758 (+) Transcript_11657:71-2344(+)|eukprot:XP_005834053.1 secretory protein 23A [Guillardia theta CCMP2712]